MPVTRIPLAQVRVKEPCPVAWDTMTGDDKTRHCSFCNLNVHNLSAMTEDAAQKLICETAGRLCIAYFPNADGSPRTLEYRPQAPPRWTWRKAGVFGAIAAGCASYFTRTPATPPGPVLWGTPAVGGLIAMPPTTNPAPNPPPGIVGDYDVPASQPSQTAQTPLACE